MKKLLFASLLLIYIPLNINGTNCRYNLSGLRFHNDRIDLPIAASQAMSPGFYLPYPTSFNDTCSDNEQALEMFIVFSLLLNDGTYYNKMVRP